MTETPSLQPPPPPARLPRLRPPRPVLRPTADTSTAAALQRTWRESVRTSAPLLVADIIAIAIGIGCGRVVVDCFGGAHPAGIEQLAGCAALAVLIHMFLALYPGTALAPVDELRRGTIGITGAHCGMLVWLAARGPSTTTDLMAVAVGAIASVAAFALLRPAVRRLCAHQRWWGQSAVIVSRGSAQAAESLMKALRNHPEHCLIPVAVVDESSSSTAHLLASWSITVADIEDHRGPELVVGMAATPHHLVVHPQWATEHEVWTPIIRTLGLPGLRITNRLLTLRSMVTKRAMDATASLAMLIVLGPLFLLLAALVQLTSPGQTFFGHTRIGRNNRRFRAWKFRTMVPNAQLRLEEHLRANPDAAREWAATQKLARDPRVTRVGSFLRRTSLDELPQLWNVLMGDMSLVGPRPIVENEIERYGDLFHAYLQVRPGITGLWQVSGRNNTTYAQRIELDAFYVRNWSLWLDLLILFRTFRVVARREGAR